MDTHRSVDGREKNRNKAAEKLEAVLESRQNPDENSNSSPPSQEHVTLVKVPK